MIYLYNKNELQHHGIKGMHWGIRRFQDKNGRRTAAGKKRYQEESGKSEQTTSDKKARAMKYAKIGAGVAVAALGAYIGYKAYQKYGSRIRDDVDATLTMRKMKKNLGKDNLEWIKENLVINSSDNGVRNEHGTNVMGLDVSAASAVKKTLSKSSSDVSIKEVIKGVNPTGSITNCRAGAAGVAARLGGFKNAIAKNVPGGEFREMVNACFKNVEVKEMFSPNKEKITNALNRRFENGDYGAIQSTIRIRGNDCAHAFNWKKENDKIRFFDGQKGLDDMNEYLNLINPSKSCEFVKLSGAEINYETIGKFVDLNDK